MIRLNPAPTFEVPVRLTVPGQTEPVEVPITFKHMKKTDMAGFWTRNEARPVADVLVEIVVGWRDVVDDDGLDVPFSPEALGKLVDGYPASAAELLRAWQIGLTESRVKN